MNYQRKKCVHRRDNHTFSAIFTLVIMFSPIAPYPYGNINQRIEALEKKEIKAIEIGEQLHYRITWNSITSGYAFMAIPKTIRFRNTECFLIQSGSKSSGAIGALYPVSDINTSYWDPIAKRTLYHEKRIEENNFFRFYSADFQYDTGYIKWQQKTTQRESHQKKKSDPVKKIIQGKHPIKSKQINDILSGLYIHRMLTEDKTYVIGDIILISLFDNGKRSDLGMIVKDIEEIKLNVNGNKKTYQALVIHPETKTSGLFHSSTLSTIWISNDKKKWPLLIETQLPIGILKMSLYQTINLN